MENGKRRFCRNCGTHILAESIQCVFCGSFQSRSSIPFFRFAAESKFFRTKVLYPALPVLGLVFFIVHIILKLETIPLYASTLFFLWVYDIFDLGLDRRVDLGLKVSRRRKGL